MERIAIAPVMPEFERRPQLALLLADDEASMRVLLADRATHAVEGLRVLEADNGAEAVQIGLQQRPRLALLDVQMPRLGGIEAAITLRELRPRMRVALYTADPHADRERARELRLPMFDKLDADDAIRWLELEARALVARRRQAARPPQKFSFECSTCGYGAARLAPPKRCPMCQCEDTWTHTTWRPFSGSTRRTSAP
jgi:CheY-like chemotaxis protein